MDHFPALVPVVESRAFLPDVTYSLVASLPTEASRGVMPPPPTPKPLPSVAVSCWEEQVVTPAMREAFRDLIFAQVAECGSNHTKRIQRLNILKNQGWLPWQYKQLQYSLARAYDDRRIAQISNLARKVRHQQNQHRWFFEGGQRRAWLQKNPYGNLNHLWFKRLYAQVCGEAFSDERCLVKRTMYAEGELDAAPKRVPRAPREDYGPYYGNGDRGVFPQPGEVGSTPMTHRQRVILAVLRYRIQQLVQKRTNVVWVAYRAIKGVRVHPCARKNVYDAVHQMDTGESGEPSCIQVAQSSNVVITSQHAASAASETPGGSAARLVSSDKIDSYDNLVNRELVFKTFQWTSSDVRNKSLQSIDLPRDFIINNKTSTNVIPFRFNRYMRGDMRVRMQINSSPFMIGSLQMAFYYQANSDQNYSIRNNIAGNSQTLHTLVNAGSSNEAILIIPYKNFKPMVEIGQRADKDSACYIGRLEIKVLNPLTVTSTVSNECSVTLFLSFENTEFTGYIDSNLNSVDNATHEMEVAAGMLAMSVAERMIDGNRDNPTTSAHPTFMTPQTAQSWSYGTNTSETTFDLRLMRADCPHPPRYTDAAFTQRDVVARYGYCHTDTWKNSAAEGALLTHFEAAPMVDESFYYKQVSANEHDIYTLPPVAFVANLYQYWRGSLKLRLDFIATRFHTGRLLIAYIPGNFRSNATLTQAKSSTHIIFDLAECQQCNIRIPYVADKVYWPRRMQLDINGLDNYSPGYVYVFVLNRLVAMDTIPNEVPFNVYIAGGEDFECVVPAQPTMGLSWNDEWFSPTATEAVVLDGYYPFYAGTYEDLSINIPDQSYYYAILRYGTLYGHVSQLWLSKKPVYDDKDATKSVFYYLKSDGWQLPIRTVHTLPKPDAKTDIFIPYYDGNYIYALPCKGVTQAETWCQNMIAHKGDPAKFMSRALFDTIFYGYPKGDDSDPYTNGKKFIMVAVHAKARTATHQMDPRTETETPLLSGTVASLNTGFGRSQFGEGFNDFKDLCRRYQPYGGAYFTKAEADRVMFPGVVAFSFPVLPQGLDLDIGKVARPHYFWNKARDGIIPLLLSGYRFFRGSIRFRIQFPPMIDTTYFVQHVPYIGYPVRQISYRDEHFVGLEDLFNHGYAYTVQSASINRVLSFEVPFYLNYDAMLLQEGTVDRKKLNTDIAYAMSLGVVRVGCSTFAKTKNVENIVSFEIAYSLGDDARPSVFQGFPPVVFTQQIPNTSIKPPSKIELLEEAAKPVTATHQMFSWVGKMNAMTDKLSTLNLQNAEVSMLDTMSSVATASSAVEQLSTKLTTSLESSKEAYAEFLAKLQGLGCSTLLLSAFGQIAQVLNNPTISAMAIAIATFLATIGIVSFDLLSQITALFTRIFSSFQNKHPDGKKDEAQHQMETDDVVSLSSVLFAGVSTVLNTKCTMDSKFSRGLAADLVSGISDGCKDGSYFFRFLSNIIKSLIKCYDYVAGKLFPEKLGLENLVNDVDLVTKWCESALLLTQPEFASLFDACPMLINRVHSCYILGGVIMARLATVPRGVNVTVIKDLYSKIVALKTDLYERGNGGLFRREPFVLWVNGTGGIGKSHCAVATIMEMITAANIPIGTSPIYTHPAGAKYWENCNQEPVILMDDGFVTRSGELNEAELSTFMSLKSPALFTPPMAGVDKKRKRYAPELVYVNSNTPYPTLNNMEDKTALYRRRDSMWMCSLRPEYGHISVVPDETLRVYGHLQFQRYYDPKDQNSAVGRALTYQEFCREVSAHFVRFRDGQILSFQHKQDAMADTLNAVASQPELMRDPLADIIKQYANRNSFPTITEFLPHAQSCIAEGARIKAITEAHQVLAAHQMNPSHPSLSYVSKFGKDFTPLMKFLFTRSITVIGLQGLHEHFIKEPSQLLRCNVNKQTIALIIIFVDMLLPHLEKSELLSDVEAANFVHAINKVRKERSIMENIELIAMREICCEGIVLDSVTTIPDFTIFWLSQRDWEDAPIHMLGLITDYIETNKLLIVAYKDSENLAKEIRRISQLVISNKFKVSSEFEVAATKVTEIEATGVTLPTGFGSACKPLTPQQQMLKRAKEEALAAFNREQHAATIPVTKSEKVFNLDHLCVDDSPMTFNSVALYNKWLNATPPTSICKHHLSNWMTTQRLHEAQLGQVLCGIKTDKEVLVEADVDKLVTQLSEKKMLCRHLFMGAATYQTGSLGCCVGEKDVAHWCPAETSVPHGCTSACVLFPVPLLDAPCESGCVIKNTKLKKCWFDNQVKLNPGIIKQMTDDPKSVPKLYMTKTFFDKLVDIKNVIADIFCTIGKYIKIAFEKLCGAAASIFQFLKKFRMLFLGLLAGLSLFGAYKVRRLVRDEDATYGDAIRATFADAKAGMLAGAGKILPLNKWSNLKDGDLGKGEISLGEALSPETVAEHNILPSGDPRVSNRVARAAFKVKVLSGSNATHEMETHQQVCVRRIVSNTVAITAFVNTGNIKDIAPHNSDIIRGLFIGERYCLTLVHAWELFKFKGYDSILIFVKDRPVVSLMSSIEVITIENSSLLVLNFPSNVPQFKNLLNFIATEADHNLRTPSNGSLLKIDVELQEVLIPIKVHGEKLNVGGLPGASDFVAEQLYSYPAQGAGVCGALMVCYERNAPIFGMHIAGNASSCIGFAEPLYRETFYFLFDNFKSLENPKVDLEVQLGPVDLSLVDIPTTIFPVGSVPPKYQHNSSKETRIVPSAIHNFAPITTEPAPLSARDPRLGAENTMSPLIAGCAKHGEMTHNFPLDVMIRVRSRLMNFIRVYCKPHRIPDVPVLTDQQAVCGDIGLPFCDALNWNSSEGYPYFAARPAGASDKKWLFKLTEDGEGFRLNGYHPMLEKQLAFKRSERAQGRKIPTIFTDCLKDARIAKEKVSVAGKTRIFSMSPVDFTIDFRKYFYDFISAFQVSRLKCMNAIGINIFSSEWNLLAKLLLRHKNICTGDYSNFGPGLNEEVAKYCMGIILEWYDINWPNDDESNRLTRRCLAEELIGSLHLCVDLVYKVGAGIPSGSPITVVLNSLVNIFYLFVAWDLLSVSWPYELQSFQKFYDNVVLFTYGDDFIFSVSELYKDLFNTNTISACLSKFNIKLTDAFKGDVVTPYTTLIEASFLKNSFVFWGGRWWAGLDQKQIYDMVNWVQKSNDINAATIENAQMALLHAHGWGPSFFGRFRATLCDAFVKHDIVFCPRSFAEIHRLKVDFQDDTALYNHMRKIIG